MSPSSLNPSARFHRALAGTSTVGIQRATRGVWARAAHISLRLPVPALDRFGGIPVLRRFRTPSIQGHLAAVDRSGCCNISRR